MRENKNCAKCDKLYNFKKLLTKRIIKLAILKLIVYSRKTENVEKLCNQLLFFIGFPESYKLLKSNDKK